MWKLLSVPELMKRAWNAVPIKDNAESLVELKPHFDCIEPHPYLSLGAPYGEKSNPWRLRISAFRRLLKAQESLENEEPGLCFAVFDAWRPVIVQEFMVNYVINEQCKFRGINQNDEKYQTEVKSLVEEVGRFWAPPTADSLTPPPHSTGGAIDLTLAKKDDHIALKMGGEIDQIDNVSHPNYYAKASLVDPLAKEFHLRRLILRRVMYQAGFVQHPSEWWHFSFGDQLWAWSNKSKYALYGAID